MIPSLVKRLSKTLVSGRSSASNSSRREDGARSQTNTVPDGNLSSLRRQSTKELVSEEEGRYTKGKVTSKVTSKVSVSSVRTSSIMREASKAKSSLSLVGPRQASRRMSRPPVRLVEEDDDEDERPLPRKKTTLTKSPSKTPAASSSRSPSPSKSPSRQPSLSKAPSLARSGSKGSVRKSPSQGSMGKSASRGSLAKSSSKGSMSRSSSSSGPKGSLAKKGSVKAAAAAAAAKQKKKPGGKELWFEAGAYLTVRSEEGGFYLCRAVNNIYNTTKTAKVRWLGPKSGKPKKRGGRRRSRSAKPVADNAFELMYADVVDPTTILMEVEVDRRGTTYLLSEDDGQETRRLMQVALDVETGQLDKGDIGDDVEEAVQIDYEPPAKRRKLQAGASASPKSTAAKDKKPRLKKTASQKEREKAQKAKERGEKKASKKKGEDQKRKRAVKEDDTALKPNPAVKILDKDPLWDTTTHMPYVSKFSNSKLAFRAVHLKDTKLLRKLLKDPDRINKLDHHRSMMRQETALEYAIKEGNKEAAGLLMEDYYGSKFDERQRDSHADKMLLSKLGTGRYNYRSLGVGRIRPLMASRGAREGNNALIKDAGDQEDGGNLTGDDFLTFAMVSGAGTDLVVRAMNDMQEPKDQEALSFCYSKMSTFIDNFPTMLARGHNEAAGKVMKVIQNNRRFYRVPAPLWKVLVAKDVLEVPSVPPSSIDLNLKSIKGFTMIHVAASNPNPAVLEKVLDSDPNFLVSDVKGRRPIHIAAGCSSPAPLQLLLDKGANPYDADTNRETALHYAIHAHRTKNVAILLDLLSDSQSRFVDPTEGKVNGGVNRPNKNSLSPLHLACMEGQLDVVRLLVKHGANVDVKTSINSLSYTPLMCAAGAGHLDIVRCLVDAGATVEQRDRVGRTALMHAAMNGSTRVMSYLLHLGAWPNRPDTSGNTPLHYAAAYGWYFSVKLLLESGADPAVSNDWTTTPLSVAYLKGHQGVVSVLLEDHRADVNFPNEEGETLLFIACSSEKEEDLVEQIRYLIKEKGADCTITNNAGGTPLHYLADTVIHKEGFRKENLEVFYTKPEVDEGVSRVVIDICRLLVEGGCDVTRLDGEGYTPAMLALRWNNIKLAQYLVEQGSPVFSRLSREAETGPFTLLHFIANNVISTRYGDWNDVITFLTKTWTTVKGEKKSFTKELQEMAQIFDRSGQTPLLWACDQYSKTKFNNSKYYLEQEVWKWDCAFSFIQSLVRVAKSDVNATTRPRWREFGQPLADENNCHDYYTYNRAKWSPVFYMVTADDPTFTSARKHDPNTPGRGLKYLLSQGAKVNVYDLGGDTPFTLALTKNKEVSILRMLMKGGADVNLPRKVKVTELQERVRREVVYNQPPICLVASQGFYPLLEELLKLGVDPNARGEQEDSNILHILADRRSASGGGLTSGHSGSSWSSSSSSGGSTFNHFGGLGASSCNTTSQQEPGMLSLMRTMLESGVDPNARNKDRCTPLHLLVQNNAGRMDSSFEEEILMVSHHAHLSLQDRLGRIPLHYVFVVKERYDDRSPLDPVDLCKLLVKSMKSADLNIVDSKGRTALHYAAQRSASICCMYLMQKGANPDVKDKDGNTPLSLSVMAKHDSCGSVLIQNGADLKVPVVRRGDKGEEEEKGGEDRPPEWRWKPLAMVKRKEGKTEVPLFQEAIKQGLVGVSFLILEWPVEKSGITLVDAIEMAVQNSQFNVALRLLSTVMVGSGEVKAVRGENRNMLHVLALHAVPDTNPQQQVKVAQTLLDKGVSASARDRYGCTPLLYAALNRHFTLAAFLADLAGGLNARYTDGFNRNLIAASMWKCCFSGVHSQLWEWLSKLMEKKVDVNCALDYPLPTDVFGSKSVAKEVDQDPDYLQRYPGPTQQVTPLILALHCKDLALTGNLLRSAADPNMADGKGLTPLIHAVKLNAVKHVKQLLKYDYKPEIDDKDPTPTLPLGKEKKKRPVKRNVFRLTKRASDVAGASSDSSEPSSSSEEEEEEEEKVQNWIPKKEKVYRAIAKTSPVNVNTTDKNGWTALHYVACPLDIGTYDNDELVFVLGKAGARLDVRNNDGQTALDLALTHSAPKVAAMLQTLMGVDKKRQKQPVITPADHRVHDGVMRRRDDDFHADAEKQLAGGEEEMEEEEPFEPEVSPHCNITNGTIAKDEEQDLPYEVLMTKCDAHLGVWGLYNFYQIQLVHQTGQDLYVLFTRWGRIGDQGQYQHTPFSAKEAGVKEFCKIFRAKTGNKWEDIKSFEQKPRKYRVVPGEERRPPRKQKTVEFDFSTSVMCTLPGPVLKAMKIMVNIETLQKSYQRDIHVDTNVLPFGRFQRDRLLQAKQLLDDMSPLVYSIQTYRKERKERTPEEKEKHQQDCQKVSELSSDYFQLIPQKNFVYEQLRPLDQLKDFLRESKLITNLLDFEVSTRMMLAAMYRKTEVHPLDYVYGVMKCKLELMQEEDPMTQNILRFAQLGAQNRLRFEGVYRVERAGEEGRFRASAVGNRRLLWHGTRSCNLVSILNRGLVSTPLDSSLTGQRFGKGIYFSDLMSKSDDYTDSSRDDSSFMLLCEVALGKQYFVTRYDDDGDDEKKSKADEFNSSIALGYNLPDPDYDIHLPSGEVMSLGDQIYESGYCNASGQYCSKPTYHNEYIVYQEDQVCIRYLLQYRKK